MQLTWSLLEDRSTAVRLAAEALPDLAFLGTSTDAVRKLIRRISELERQAGSQTAS